MELSELHIRYRTKKLKRVGTRILKIRDGESIAEIKHRVATVLEKIRPIAESYYIVAKAENDDKTGWRTVVKKTLL